ncbi:hypothetical protein [Limnobacter sp.]|uniref:hypothetical protein n=1 Tax=Limnobacter sp. TaxID=2003368 RepID=UPI0031200FD4
MITEQEQELINELPIRFKIEHFGKDDPFTQYALEKAKFFYNAQSEAHYQNRTNAHRKNRSWPEVVKDTYTGFYLEQHLVRYHNYVYNNKKWTDVKSPNGIEVELKSFSNGKEKNAIDNLRDNRSTKYNFVVTYKKTWENNVLYYTFASVYKYIDDDYKKVYAAN